MERFNKPVNMGRNSPDLLEPNEYKARYAFGPFKIREPTYALHRAQTQPSHGSAVVPLGVGSGLRRRAVAAAGVEPRSFQPGTIRDHRFDGLALASLSSLRPRPRVNAVRVVAGRPGGRGGVPRRVRARRRRVGYGAPACARRYSLLP